MMKKLLLVSIFVFYGVKSMPANPLNYRFDWTVTGGTNQTFPANTPFKFDPDDSSFMDLLITWPDIYIFDLINCVQCVDFIGLKNLPPMTRQRFFDIDFNDGTFSLFTNGMQDTVTLQINNFQTHVNCCGGGITAPPKSITGTFKKVLVAEPVANLIILLGFGLLLFYRHMIA